MIANARQAMAEGDYRWSAELLNHLVFAEPGNTEGRALLADSYEQMGYQAESGIWRNMYLMGAKELREGVTKSAPVISSDIVAAMPMATFLDLLATRLNPSTIGDWSMTLLLRDSGGPNSRITVRNGVMIGEAGKDEATPTASITGNRRLFLSLFVLKLPIAQLEAEGLRIEGDRESVKALQSAIDSPASDFSIVTP